MSSARPPYNQSIVKKTVHAACPHDCPDACGVLITVDDGRAVKIQGDPAHPVTRGFLCAKWLNIWTGFTRRIEFCTRCGEWLRKVPRTRVSAPHRLFSALLGMRHSTKLLRG